MITEGKITTLLGKRCISFHEDCATCQMWSMFDMVQALTDKIESLEDEIDRVISSVDVGLDPMRWVRFNYRNISESPALIALKLHSEYEDLDRNDRQNSVAWERFVKAKNYALSLHDAALKKAEGE